MKLQFLRRLVVALCCVLPAGAALAQSKAPVKLWGASATLEAYHSFLFLANPLGFYKQQGVEVEFGTVAGSAAALQLVASNQVNMAYVGMDVLILAKATNPSLPVKAVYLQDRGNIYEIVVPESSAIKSVAELNGKNIGIANLASGAIPNLKGMLADAGLNPESSVGLIPVGNGAQAAAALRSGRVDALSLFRAQHALIETLGVNFRYFKRESPSAVLIVNSNYLAANRDAVTKVLRGVVLASTFAEANPEATVREFWKLFGKPQGLSDQEALSRSMHILKATSGLWKDYRDTGTRWGDMTAKQWEDMQKFLITQKLLTAAVPTDQLFTVELIDEVNKVDLAPALKAAEAAK